MTHYETLGVSKTASPEEIKSAYRMLAKKHHPDAGGDAAKFAEISNAYDILSNSAKRAEYDSPTPQHGFTSSGFPFDINDFFGQAFSAAQFRRNRNLRTAINLDFLDTLEPRKMTISVPLTNGGENLDIEVPPGVDNGQVVVLRGYGDNSDASIPRGNLEILFNVTPHPEFTRVGFNVVKEISIDCIDAMLGTEVPVVLPVNSKLTLITVPPGTQNGAQFGIPDQGFMINTNTRGKFILKVNVIVPIITDEQKEILKQLRS
jgi:curved DNA-binding protein